MFRCEVGTCTKVWSAWRNCFFAKCHKGFAQNCFYHEWFSFYDLTTAMPPSASAAETATVWRSLPEIVEKLQAAQELCRQPNYALSMTTLVDQGLQAFRDVVETVHQIIAANNANRGKTEYLLFSNIVFHQIMTCMTTSSKLVLCKTHWYTPPKRYKYGILSSPV